MHSLRKIKPSLAQTKCSNFPVRFTQVYHSGTKLLWIASKKVWPPLLRRSRDIQKRRSSICSPSNMHNTHIINNRNIYPSMNFLCKSRGPEAGAVIMAKILLRHFEILKWRFGGSQYCGGVRLQAMGGRFRELIAHWLYHFMNIRNVRYMVMGRKLMDNRINNSNIISTRSLNKKPKKSLKPFTLTWLCNLVQTGQLFKHFKVIAMIGLPS